MSSRLGERKKIANFNRSEPELLISYLDRHEAWAVVVCLVGGGQEIHTGEAGIGEWFEAVRTAFPHWRVYVSPNLTDSEYAAQLTLERLDSVVSVVWDERLHLATSMRPFRTAKVSAFVNAIDVRVNVDPVQWFLNDRHDTRSSYYLEDAATESQVQGLELDWVCVTWDADLRRHAESWRYHSFRGDAWTTIHKEDRKRYLLNAYRVLLTRAPAFYNDTYEYLTGLGVAEVTDRAVDAPL